MICPWLVVFFNFSGITFVEIPRITSWKESKILKRFFFVKLPCVILFFLAIWLNTNFKKYIFNYDLIDGYSGFTVEVMELSDRFFHVGGFIMLVIQYRRRRKVIKFLAAFKSYKLKESSKSQFKKRFVALTFVNLIFLVVQGVLIHWVVVKRNFLFESFSTFIVTQTNVIYYAFIMLFLYIQSFIVIALKEVREDVNYSWSRTSLENSFLKLEKIENMLDALMEIFGHQLTIVTTIYLLLVVVLVSYWLNEFVV